MPLSFTGNGSSSKQANRHTSNSNSNLVAPAYHSVLPLEAPFVCVSAMMLCSCVFAGVIGRDVARAAAFPGKHQPAGKASSGSGGSSSEVDEMLRTTCPTLRNDLRPWNFLGNKTWG